MRKRKFAGIVWVVMLLLLTQSTAFAVVYGKTGYTSQGYSEATAWEIDSAATLEKVRDDVNEGRLNYTTYFKLTKDIDLTGYQSWTPIGGTADSFYYDPLYITHFRGHFNGNGHTIKVNISELETNRERESITDCSASYSGVMLYIISRIL